MSQTKINPLLSYLEKGQIAATKCEKCGRTYFPPRADCLDDRHSALEWVVLDGKSNLVTFTKVFFAPPAFQPETPYLLGLAELSNGLRVFAPISASVEEKQLKPGKEMNLKAAKGARDNLFYWLE
ncbi:Zn-ribbon domain-containing OB-fold protein [Candidatus Bathyarchaeota archaeon]|nr:MAG: Zn-ribbon domain-containing OB-fold protein [Candidatus Bathyarchaeota archaeon]